MCGQPGRLASPDLLSRSMQPVATCPAFFRGMLPQLAPQRVARGNGPPSPGGAGVAVAPKVMVIVDIELSRPLGLADTAGQRWTA